MIRDFCSGLIRAKTVVVGMAAARPSSSSASSSAPLSVPARARPMSRQTLAATIPLSPVMILTSTPRRSSWAIDAPASALGRSAKVRKPTRMQVALVGGLGAAVAPVLSRSRVATATTRAPSANRRVEGGPGTGRRVRAAGQDGLGRALGDEQAATVGVRPRSRRRAAVRGRRGARPAAGRRRGRPPWRPAPGPPAAAHRAWSRALPPTGPSRCRRLRCRPGRAAAGPDRRRRRRVRGSG